MARFNRVFLCSCGQFASIRAGMGLRDQKRRGLESQDARERLTRLRRAGLHMNGSLDLCTVSKLAPYRR